MRSNLLSWMKGNVRLEIHRGNTEQMLNRMMHESIEIWNIRRLENGHLEFYIHIKDFFQLRALLKKTGCRLMIQNKYGLPFWLQRLEGRKWFAAGIGVFIILLILLSSLIWEVEIETGENIPHDVVEKAAKAQGIHPLQWKFKLKDPDMLSERLMQSIPDSSWIGVEIIGTKVYIQVIESTIPEEQPLLNPRHMVSNHDAVITKMIAEKGNPVVQKDTRVRKGDILISGIIGDEENKEVVVAKGEVWGMVWYEYQIKVPMENTINRFTGKEFQRNYFVVGERALKIWGYGKVNYQYSEQDVDQHRLRFKDFNLPFGWLKETIQEVIPVAEHRTKQEARMLGLEQARADVMNLAGEQSKLNDEEMLSIKEEENTLNMKVLFEVEQLISKEQAIVIEEKLDEEKKDH